MEKKTTIIMGADGVEYVVRGGKLEEKCLHRTVRDESSGKTRKEVCHDCGKVLIYNSDTTQTTNPIEQFYANHSRSPNGMELSAMF